MRQLPCEFCEIRALALPLLAALLDGLMRRRPVYSGDEVAVVGLLRFGLKLWADQWNARWSSSRRLHLLLQLRVEQTQLLLMRIDSGQVGVLVRINLHIVHFVLETAPLGIEVDGIQPVIRADGSNVWWYVTGKVTIVI